MAFEGPSGAGPELSLAQAGPAEGEAEAASSQEPGTEPMAGSPAQLRVEQPSFHTSGASGTPEHVNEARLGSFPSIQQRPSDHQYVAPSHKPLISATDGWKETTLKERRCPEASSIAGCRHRLPPALPISLTAPWWSVMCRQNPFTVPRDQDLASLRRASRSRHSAVVAGSPQGLTGPQLDVALSEAPPATNAAPARQHTPQQRYLSAKSDTRD